MDISPRILRHAALLSVCLACLLGAAEVSAKAPFTSHLRDAIQLNKQRAPRYAKLTAGQSRNISRRMILLERLTLPVAKFFDWRARKYQRAGVPLLSEDLIHMDKTPRFSKRLAFQPPPHNRFVPANGRAIAKRIRKSYKREKWSGVSRVAEEELGKIRAAAPHHTMIRHMLESIARVAHLAPKHSKLARDKGMKPTDTFSWRMIQLHLFSLPSFAKLDKLAAPLQSRGVPILYQDVPPIPLRSTFYDGAVTPASTPRP